MGILARSGIAVLASVVGGAIGTVTTFAHASLVPWALVVGAVIVVGYVLGVRLAFDERMPAAAAALGVMLAVVLIASVPVDTVVLDTGSPLAVVWLVVAPLAAVAALAVPLPRRAEGSSGEA